MVSDFTDIVDAHVDLVDFEEDTDVDFVEIGDNGVVIIIGGAYGEGAYGEGPYGGGQTILLINDFTQWTDIDEP